MSGTRHSQGKLIIVTHEFAPFCGGAATYAAELAAALHRARTAVEVWAPGNGVKEDGQMSFPVLRLPVAARLGLGDVWKFANELEARRNGLEDATVILASAGAHMAFMLNNSRGRMRNQRVISLLHGSEALRFSRNPFWRLLATRFFKRVEKIITVSKFSRSLIEKSFLHPFAKEILIAPGVCSAAAMQPATRVPVNDGKLRVLTLARIHPRKGQLDTARALARLPAETKRKIIYQIGGTGDSAYLQKIERACREANLAFENLGGIEPDVLADTYAQCDIYAMASQTLARSVEGFGITYLEAGFHGKPVVGYRSGGVAEAVVDGETGLLVEEGDLSALTDALVKLISGAQLRERLGDAGRRHAAKFSWDVTAKAFLQPIS